MSITEETQREMDLWQAEMDSSQEKIFEFLNRRENLCTPGFILRRQLQMKFPKLVEKAAWLETYADLTKTGKSGIECRGQAVAKLFERQGELSARYCD